MGTAAVGQATKCLAGADDALSNNFMTQYLVKQVQFVDGDGFLSFGRTDDSDGGK